MRPNTQILREGRQYFANVINLIAKYAEIADSVYFLRTSSEFFDYLNNDHASGDIVILNPKEQITTHFTINREILGLTIPNNLFYTFPFDTTWQIENDPNTGNNASILIGFGSGFNNPIEVNSNYTKFVGGIAFGSSGGFQVNTNSNVFQWISVSRIEFASGTSGNTVGDCSDMTIIDNGSNKVDTDSVS